MKFVFAILLGLIAIALMVMAYGSIYGLLTPVSPPKVVETNYADIVVVLLTTVTVIFTVAAIVIGILAFLGPRAIKREATKFAEAAVIKSIEDAMKPGGRAATLIELNFPPHEGPIKGWLEDKVEQQVFSLLPLMVDKFQLKSDVGPVDPAAPDDEGQVD